jgi:2-succinyl-5-enolpyruvyl-6-hydroxy-3-cyclohexene-1-carboxylate synthase
VTYGVEYHSIKNWSELSSIITQNSNQAIRLLEIITNRESDALWLKNNLIKFTEDIPKD